MKRSLLYGIAANLVWGFVYYLYFEQPLPRTVSNSVAILCLSAGTLLAWTARRNPESKSWWSTILFWGLGFFLGFFVAGIIVVPAFYMFGQMPKGH
jgi:hypothetical protein